MPGKSRHGKGKQPVRGKKKRTGHGSMSVAAQPSPVSQAHGPVSHPEVSTPPPSTSTPSSTISTVRYPYITTELRRIGILAGITLIILVVLALVLS